MFSCEVINIQCIKIKKNKKSDILIMLIANITELPLYHLTSEYCSNITFDKPSITQIW